MSASIINRPGPDPIAAEIQRAGQAIADAIAKNRGNAVLLAERTLSQLRAVAALRAEELAGLIAAKQAQPGGINQHSDPEIMAAATASNAAREAVAVARRDLAGLRAARAPDIAASVAPHAAVLGAIAESLLDHLERLADVLAEAGDNLARAGASPSSRLAAGPILLRLVRDARRSANGG